MVVTVVIMKVNVAYAEEIIVTKEDSEETGILQSRSASKPEIIVTKDEMYIGNVLNMYSFGNDLSCYATATIEDAEAEETNSVIYYGTVAGHLSSMDDYVLYPITLEAGYYLQARLTLPVDSQIDYDLLLFDDSLSLIKSSDYVTCMTSNTATLDESVGYLATTTEKIYICVYSVGGGSDTETYTLDYTVTTNFSETNEPDENTKEAMELSLDASGANVSGMINSVLDNDWYSFTVLDDPTYEKIRLNISSSSDNNGCKIEIYQNLISSNYYAMLQIGSGTGGEIDLPAGNYYLRVVSTNSFDDFDAGDIPVYTLSVVPVSRVDEIVISELAGYNGTTVNYGQGNKYRVDECDATQNRFGVYGVAYYIDDEGVRHRAANVQLNGIIKDQQWLEISRPDMAYVYSTGTTDSNGLYRMTFYLNSALGGLTYDSLVSTHHYDSLDVTICSEDESVAAYESFYLLKYCDNF